MNHKVPMGGTETGTDGIVDVDKGGGGTRDMFFAWDLFLRLESFVHSCPYYTRNFEQALAVVFSYTSLVLYILFFAVCRLYRGVAIACFVVGFTLSGVLVWLLGRFVPALSDSAAPCASTPDNRAAEEATIAVYSALFVVLYDYAFVDTSWTARSCGRVIKYVVIAAGVIVAGTVSPYLIGVQTSAALLVGSSAGILAAGISVAALTHISRLSPSQRVFLRVLCDTAPEEEKVLYAPVSQSDVAADYDDTRRT